MYPFNHFKGTVQWHQVHSRCRTAQSIFFMFFYSIPPQKSLSFKKSIITPQKDKASEIKKRNKNKKQEANSIGQTEIEKLKGSD